MKILCLVAENVKRLKAVTIRPDGNLVVISGKNGAGKTSVLDSIFWALAGAHNVQQMPIRKGAGRARIKLNLGEIFVQRTFSRRVKDDAVTTSLIVETAEGARYPSPQTILDDLIGSLSFDPLAFSRAPVKDQVDMLKRLVPDVDFDAIADANKRDYDERTEVNRAAKRARGAMESVQLPAVVPAELEEVDENDIVLELEQAGQHNTGVERQKAARQRTLDNARLQRAKAADNRARAERLRREADELDAEAAECETDATDLEQKVFEAGDLPEAIDTREIRARLDAARKHNDLVERLAEWKKHGADLEQAERRAHALTDAINARNAQKRAAIDAANLPVPGLNFDEDHVELNDVPFEQASDAEQLRASCAIAAALNPKLRVIRIRDGSLLDEDGLALLAAFADEQDMQVWLEKVDNTGKVGFVIEDGHLAGDDEPPADAPTTRRRKDPKP